MENTDSGVVENPAEEKAVAAPERKGLNIKGICAALAGTLCFAIAGPLVKILFNHNT